MWFFSGRQTKTGRQKSIYAYREKAVKGMKTFWKKIHKTITDRTVLIQRTDEGINPEKKQIHSFAWKGE